MQIRLASCVIITQSSRPRPSMNGVNSSLCNRPHFEALRSLALAQLIGIPTLRQQLTLNSQFHVELGRGESAIFYLGKRCFETGPRICQRAALVDAILPMERSGSAEHCRYSALQGSREGLMSPCHPGYLKSCDGSSVYITMH